MGLRRTFRLWLGRCPYCNEKLLNGMGGSSVLFLGGMKCCPNKCYAEELHYTGATLIYDNDGLPLEVEGLEEEGIEI